MTSRSQRSASVRIGKRPDGYQIRKKREIQGSMGWGALQRRDLRRRSRTWKEATSAASEHSPARTPSGAVARTLSLESKE